MKRTPLPPRSTPLKRTPVRKKRKTPRRGRVIEKSYLAWCAKQPCCITGELPATTHHVRFCGSPKDDRIVIRLVERLHLHEAGMFSIERLGKEKFEARWKVDIMHQAGLLYGMYLRETGREPVQ